MTEENDGRAPAKKTPKRKRKMKIVGDAERTEQLVREVFREEVEFTENGVNRTGTVFEAIALQLCLKASAGNKRALSILHKYESYARRESNQSAFEIVVVKNEDYSEALAESKRRHG